MQMFVWDNARMVKIRSAKVRNRQGSSTNSSYAKVRQGGSSFCKRFVSKSSYADVHTGKSSYGTTFLAAKIGYEKRFVSDKARTG